jgi:hypothetical protein
MAESNTERMSSLLESIDNTLSTQTDILTNMFNFSKEQASDSMRAERLSSESSTVSAGGLGSTISGIGGGIGGAVSGIGGGIGGLLGGAGKGIGFAGLGIGAAFLGLSTILDQFDADAVKESVETLLTIGEGYESRTEFLKEGGTLGLALAGIGAGLAIFSVGQAAQGLAQFGTDDDWAQKVKDNVETLLSISELSQFGSAGVLFEGGTLGSALAGLGVGLAIFSVGQAAQGLAQFVTDDGWAQNVKDNVETLLSIGDSGFFGSAGVLVKGGTLTAAMTGLGIGLAVFSVGQAAQGLAQFVTDDDWAQNVKDNIETLLSIGTLNFWDTAGLVATMAGLGAGLTAFAIGKGVEGGAEGAQEALEKFSGDKDFAQRVKDEVETLLSISELPGVSWGGIGTFIGVMGGIAAGLAAFALGKGVEGAAEVGQEGLSYFTDQNGFATRVKGEVETLLSIAQLPGVSADTTQFVKTMGGIGLGLAAFALGKGVEGGTEAGQQALSYFTDQEDFATRIKNQVITLLSITELTSPGDAEDFGNALGSIGGALAKFGAGNFVGTLADAGASIVSFFTGAESPFQQIRAIAADAENLTQAATAIDSLNTSLVKLGQLNFDGGNLNLKAFAEDLKESVPIIEAAIMGQEGGYLFGETIQGLASPNVNYDQAIKNINMLREALGYDVRTSAINSAAVASGNGGGSIVNAPVTNAPVTNAPVTNNTTIVQQNKSPSDELAVMP